MTAVAIAGTFDPIHNGHIDLIERCSRHFDNVVVFVSENPSKRPWFARDDRVSMILDALSDLHNVEVIKTTEKLLVDDMDANCVFTLVKGIRNYQDFEYESNMAAINNQLDNDVETLFLNCSPLLSSISSSTYKDLLKLDATDLASAMLPAYIHEQYVKLFSSSNP